MAAAQSAHRAWRVAECAPAPHPTAPPSPANIEFMPVSWSCQVNCYQCAPGTYQPQATFWNQDKVDNVGYPVDSYRLCKACPLDYPGQTVTTMWPNGKMTGSESIYDCFAMDENGGHWYGSSSPAVRGDGQQVASAADDGEHASAPSGKGAALSLGARASVSTAALACAAAAAALAAVVAAQ